MFGPVWLPAVVLRHLGRRLRWAGPVVSRSAYGAFTVQGLVLIELALAWRPLSLPAEVEAVLVVTGGLAGSFGLAWLLISRVPVWRASSDARALTIRAARGSAH